MSVPKLIYIGGVAITTPQTLKLHKRDMDSEDGTGRTQDGVMHRDRIRTDVNELDLTFPPLYGNELKKIIEYADQPSFTVKFWDVYRYVEKEFYCGDRNYELMKYDPIKGDWLYKNISFNLIEM